MCYTNDNIISYSLLGLKMTNKTCCFTGHRDLPTDQIEQITEQLDHELIRLIEQGYCTFGAGGALGFDTIAAQRVLRLRERYSYIKLILVLPCLTQSKKWCPQDHLIYEEIKRKADQVVFISQDYVRGCMHKRNRYLVEHSSVCICYLDKSVGGTAYTVDYARKNGKTIINIADLIE